MILPSMTWKENPTHWGRFLLCTQEGEVPELALTSKGQTANRQFQYCIMIYLAIPNILVTFVGRKPRWQRRSGPKPEQQLFA